MIYRYRVVVSRQFYIEYPKEQDLDDVAAEAEDMCEHVDCEIVGETEVELVEASHGDFYEKEEQDDE